MILIMGFWVVHALRTYMQIWKGISLSLVFFYVLMLQVHYCVYLDYLKRKVVRKNKLYAHSCTFTRVLKT